MFANNILVSKTQKEEKEWFIIIIWRNVYNVDCEAAHCTKRRENVLDAILKEWKILKVKISMKQ